MERKIPASGEIEVYINESGMVCIREGGMFSSDDSIVALHPKHVATVIQWLQECLAEAEQMREDGALEGTQSR